METKRTHVGKCLAPRKSTRTNRLEDVLAVAYGAAKRDGKVYAVGKVFKCSFAPVWKIDKPGRFGFHTTWEAEPTGDIYRVEPLLSNGKTLAENLQA